MEPVSVRLKLLGSIGTRYILKLSLLVVTDWALCRSLLFYKCKTAMFGGKKKDTRYRDIVSMCWNDSFDVFHEY